MKAVRAAGWAAATALALRGASGTANAVTSLRWLRAAREDHPEHPSVRFTVVVPLLREQALVGDLARRLTQLAGTHPGTRVALVTTC